MIQSVDRSIRILLALQGARRMNLSDLAAQLGLPSSTLDSLEFRSRTLKWAEELARRTGHAVRAGVLLLGDVVIVYHEPRPDGSRQMPEVGFVIPAHACALGKALLAYRPDDLASLLDEGPLRSMTGETVVDAP